MTTTINADNVTGGAVVTGDSSGELGLQTAGTTRMTITSAGKVGIGVTAPGSLLEVRGANVAAGQNDGFVQFRTTTTQAADVGAALQLGGLYDASNYLGFGEIAGRKENSTSGNWSGYLQFATREYGGSFAERMRITSAGNVGIGTSSPQKKLNVVDNSSSTTIGGSTAVIQVGNSNGGSTNLTAGIELFGSGAPSSGLGNRSGGVYGVYESYNASGNAGALVLATNPAGTTSVVERMRIDSSGNVGIGVDKYLSFNLGDTNSRIQSDSGSGYMMYRGYSGHIFYDTATGSERMRITSAGNVGIGLTPNGSYRLHVKSGGTSNATRALQLVNSADADLFSIWSDGTFNTGTAANAPYNATTGSAANLYVDSSGYFYRSTSSLRYKTDIQDATHGLAEVLKLRSVTYKGNGKTDGDTVFGGLIAEEVDAAGLKEFVVYDKDGQPDALHYGNMVALLTKAIQEQQQQIDALKAEVAALKGE